jgi:hypothetical protein
MSELLESNPEFFPIFFLGMWVAICLLISRFGGWARLSESYTDRSRFSGEKNHFQSFSMGLASYGSCATIGVNRSHLFLGVMWIFRIGSPNLFIPYADIVGREVKRFFFGRVHLTFNKAPGVTLKLSRRQADRIELASGGAWNYDRT